MNPYRAALRTIVAHHKRHKTRRASRCPECRDLINMAKEAARIVEVKDGKEQRNGCV